MTDEKLDIPRTQRATFNESGRFVAENCHPDVEWVTAKEDPDADTHRGPDAIQRYFDGWSEMVEGIRLDEVEARSAGDKAFFWIRISGTGAASGAPVEMEQAQVWTFRDRKAIRIEEFFDRDEGLRAAGLQA
jgi:ketosteroid isomerase-like protein